MLLSLKIREQYSVTLGQWSHCEKLPQRSWVVEGGAGGPVKFAFRTQALPAGS